MADYPGNSLKTGAKDLLSSGLYSDLAIVCGDKEFNVHKFALHTQSAYFKKLLAGKFKEGAANSNLLRLELDEDPDIFTALIKHLYHFAYNDSSRGDVPVAPFAVYVYAAADKYDIEPLRKQAAKRLREAQDPKDVDAFIDAERAIDEYTADQTLWDIVLPAMKANMALLLGHREFRELLDEKKDLNYRLLAMIDPSGALPQTIEPDGQIDDHLEGDMMPTAPLRTRRHGFGSRLG